MGYNFIERGQEGAWKNGRGQFRYMWEAHYRQREQKYKVQRQEGPWHFSGTARRPVCWGGVRKGQHRVTQDTGEAWPSL